MAGWDWVRPNVDDRPPAIAVYCFSNDNILNQRDCTLSDTTPDATLKSVTDLARYSMALSLFLCCRDRSSGRRS